MAAWSVRTVEEDPGAPFFNDTTKFVVSSTLETTNWRNSTIVGPLRPRRHPRLKESVDRGIYVSGSATLVRALLADGLVDELHLCLYSPIHSNAGRGASPFRGYTSR
jgi:dihydrofolate reductase